MHGRQNQLVLDVQVDVVQLFFCRAVILSALLLNHAFFEVFKVRLFELGDELVHRVHCQFNLCGHPVLHELPHVLCFVCWHLGRSVVSRRLVGARHL